MASPTVVDHEMVSGDTAKPLVVQITDEDGNPRDITGWSLRYVAYYSEASAAAAALDKSTGSGTVEITDAATGMVRIPFEAADTSSLGNRALPHELEGRDPAGTIETVMVGGLRLRRDFAA